MKDYIYNLIVAALITGVINLLGDKLKGDFDKIISIVCSFVILYYLVTPLVGLPGNETVIDSGVIPFDTEIINSPDGDILINEAEKNLNSSSAALLSSEFGLTKNDIDISFTLVCDENSVKISKIAITLKSLHALSVRNQIKEKIADEYSVQCDFTEKIPF